MANQTNSLLFRSIALRQLLTNKPSASGKKLKTLLVDSNFLLKRSIQATSKSQEYYTKGGNMGGIYQFMVSLRKLVKDLKINKSVLMWDGENGGKLRYDIYRDYKANRENKTWYSMTTLSEAQIKDLERSKRSTLVQRICIQQYAEELYMRQVEVDIIEADDLIAYYCKLYHLEEDIIIFTNDRDMCQLLELDGVSIYMSNLKCLIDKNSYFLYFNHHFSNACLMKVILGDDADNIRGIHGAGEKTLLEHFPELKTEKLTYQHIVERAAQINKERVESKPKKKPLKVLTNIVNGTYYDKIKEVEVSMGEEFYILNNKLVNLDTPMLNREAVSALKDVATLPLTPEDRGSKNLLELFKRDSFLNLYKGTFVSFVEPFYPVVIQEQEYFKNNC
jgi:5'-3' exonuclease